MPVLCPWSRSTIAAVVVALVVVACGSHASSTERGQTSDPASDPKAGAALVQNSNCSGCHGGQFQGDLGPKLVGIEKRRTPEQIAKAITNPEPPMPKFPFTPQQVADVVAYISQLDGGGAGAMQPKISLSPAKPTDSAIVSVWFPGTLPTDATVEATMRMGHSTMGTSRIKLNRTNDPNTLRAKVPFGMGGAWMIKVHYNKTQEVDMPIEVGQ